MNRIVEARVKIVGEGDSQTLLNVKNLKIEDSKKHVIIGSSGSGKSLLLKTLLRIISSPRLSVSCEIEGPLNDAVNNGRVFYLPPDPASVIPDGIQIREYCKLIPSVRTERLRESFDLVNLSWTSIGTKFARELSGGQRQRVLIGMLGASEVELVVMDEPTIGLDETNVAHLKNAIDLIRNYRNGDYIPTVLFATHSPFLVQTMKPDRYILLRDGGVYSSAQISRLRRIKEPVALAITSRTTRRTVDVVHGEIGGKTTEKRDALNIEIDEQIVGRSLRQTGKSYLGPFRLQVHRGIIHAVVGNSGCGKTTLLRAISRSISETTGAVLYSDIDLVKAQKYGEYRDNGRFRREFRPWIFYMTQHAKHSLFGSISVGEGLRLSVLSQTGRVPTRSEIERSLHRLKIPINVLSRYPAELSTGEVRRIDLVRLDLVKPDILLLDEPFSNLDLPIAAEIAVNLARMVMKEHLLCVLVSHRMEIVQDISDRYEIDFTRLDSES